MLRTIGLPELLVILGVLLMTALPIVATGVVVWLIARRNSRSPTLASKPCRHCGQRIPDLGTFCPMCGRNTV